MIKDTVGITADVAAAENDGVVLRYLELDGTQKEITASYGDIVIIINTLADYAELLEEYVQEYPDTLNNWQKANYGYQASRCRNIYHSLERQMMYDREANIEKCRKQREKKEEDSDVGEDAMILAVRKAHNDALQKARKKQREQEKAQGPNGLAGQISLF